jgi:hypothetical protein
MTEEANSSIKHRSSSHRPFCPQQDGLVGGSLMSLATMIDDRGGEFLDRTSVIVPSAIRSSGIGMSWHRHRTRPREARRHRERPPEPRAGRSPAHRARAGHRHPDRASEPHPHPLARPRRPTARPRIHPHPTPARGRRRTADRRRGEPPRGRHSPEAPGLGNHPGPAAVGDIAPAAPVIRADGRGPVPSERPAAARHPHLPAGRGRAQHPHEQQARPDRPRRDREFPVYHQSFTHPAIGS